MTCTGIPRACVRHARTQAQATRDALIEALRAYHQAALADVPPVVLTVVLVVTNIVSAVLPSMRSDS